jgi:heterodisulfide reductase subunit B
MSGAGTDLAMKIGYYPGCTLKTKAKNLEDSALAALAALGLEAEELPRWNCCGAVFSLADDDLIHHIAPVRDLIRAKDMGCEQLITLCSMCYNTLARANRLMAEEEEKRETINRFMEEESDYAGEVQVLHYLDFLRRAVGFEQLQAKVQKPLSGLRVAPYYGCTLLRPREVAIESPDLPAMFGEFLAALGAEVVPFAEATTCCSSYQILANEAAAFEAAAKILRAASADKVDVLALSCPVCEYNLGRRQGDIRAKHEGFGEVPTLYFTQLLALALGLPAEQLGLKFNEPVAVALLKDKKLVAEELSA